MKPLLHITIAFSFYLRQHRVTVERYLLAAG